MMKSLHTITAQAVKAYAVTKREDWIINCNCGQAVLAVSQIYWTKEVAVALQAGGAEALQTFADKCAKELMAEIEMVRGDLSNLERATLGALVVIDVHARDVLAAMVKDGVCAESDFAWQAQLRYYWEENTVIVRMLNGKHHALQNLCLCILCAHMSPVMMKVCNQMLEECMRSMWPNSVECLDSLNAVLSVSTGSASSQVTVLLMQPQQIMALSTSATAAGL